MRIGIDARELAGHATGVGRYLGGMLDQWARAADANAHEFVLYTTEPLARPLPSPRIATRVIPGPGGTWWEQMKLPRAAAADRLDVFFSPAYTAPLRLGVPLVVAIHDISFVAHPEWFTVREGVRRRWITAQSARLARRVITISQFTRGELMDRLNVPAEKIAVIPPGINRVVTTGETHDGGVLYVGSIFNRRRVPDLIQAFAVLARQHPALALDIVGDNRSHPHQDLIGLIAAEQIGTQARWRSYVPDDTLQSLYSRARAFAFLSEYEGLGLTPLEALACGVPIVVLDTPVARESCGDAALYVEPGHLPQLTEALRLLLFDAVTRERLLANGPAVLARYDWTTAARDTLAVLGAAAEADA